MSHPTSLYEAVGGLLFFEGLVDRFYGRLILARDVGMPDAT